MRPFLHHDSVTATNESKSDKSSGNVLLSSAELPVLTSEPPEEFGGPGNRLSSETLTLPQDTVEVIA